jgi:hypothetical protein
VGLIALIAVHGLAIRLAASRVTSRLALPATIVVGVIARVPIVPIAHRVRLTSRHAWTHRGSRPL